MEKDDEVEEKDEGKSSKKEKSSKITKKDWDKVTTYLKNELEARKRSQFRKDKEKIWKEVDRQIAMKPMVKLMRDGSEIDQGWHNVVELGELAKASENMSADVRRIVFPQSRFWFEPHSDISDQIPPDPKTGQKKPAEKTQQLVDGRVRAFMVQQHNDFGLKDRVELSVKEALHHGSFVAEVDWTEQEMVSEGTKSKTLGAPMWVPHSMWNCFPDPSPSVVGTNMFYSGSMFIESYLPRYKCEQLIKSKEDGWMASQWKKVSKDEHRVKEQTLKDVKITTYWGDISMDRPDENLFFPNHKVVLMNGTLVFFAPNETPYIPIIFRGYERTDVRDPYYTSPIIKQSPMQKLASVLTNKTMDGIELALEPPIVYDGNDPDFVINGGPVVAPGAKVSSKGSNSFSQVKIGDPGVALTGLEFAINQMKEKLGRPGKPVGDRATKAEVVKSAQDQEVSLVDFIDKIEIGLRSYLYMQHDMNKRHLEEYSFYSPEMQDPDFLRVKTKDLPKFIHFEVVGARGVLGEQERTEKVTQVTAFASGNPLFAPLLKPKEILLQMYQDAGAKSAERFVTGDNEENPAMLKQALEQAKQQLQQMGQELQQEKQKSQVKMAKIQSDAQAKEKKMQVDAQQNQQKIKSDFDAKMAKIEADLKADIAKILQQREAANTDSKIEKALMAIEHKAALAQQKMELLMAKKEEKTGEKPSEDKLISLQASMVQAIQEMSKKLSAPRMAIKDPKTGRVIGSKIGE